MASVQRIREHRQHAAMESVGVPSIDERFAEHFVFEDDGDVRDLSSLGRIRGFIRC